MNILEIARKESPTQQEIEFLIIEYIKERKGVDIERIDWHASFNPFLTIQYFHHFHMWVL